MKRPPLHPTLPFDDPSGDDGAPLEVTIRVAQPSLLGTRAAIDTDVVHALETSEWRLALDLLERLRAAATVSQTADIDAAMPTLEALASTTTVSVDQAVTLIDDIAAQAPTNAWLRHVTATLVQSVLEREGTDGLASTLSAHALPHVYRVLTGVAGKARSPSGPSSAGHLTARALLRDTLVQGVPVSLAALGDRELDVLDASDATPAWYPVLGVLERLWDVPKGKPSPADVSAVLEAEVPGDDSASARLFWDCYRVWKAQTQPTDVVSRTRARMKLLQPALFARLA